MFDIDFAPLIPWAFLITLGVLALLLSLATLLLKPRGALLRAVTLAFLLLLLANPALREDTREPLSDIALVLVDRSESQKIDGRDRRTEEALKNLQARLAQQPDLEVQVIESGVSRIDENAGTVLYDDLANALAAIDRDRLAAVFAITDGEIHDLPALETAEGTTLDHGVTAPFHTLITGRHNEVDRKLTIVKAPRFGIVGQKVDFFLRIDDMGAADPSDYTAVSVVRLTASRDGEPAQEFYLATGTEHRLSMDLTHGGESIIEFQVEPLEGELTPVNNSAVALINGVRDRLRVLLVSGEPHAGERTWRNLLKADPAVDLVHFTILRPPEKQDGTPTNELALISFPTRQLFAQKLDEFDLVIFDRYRRRGVLPLVYLSNIARYVSKGGALLTAAGPSFATPYSLFRTPLAEVLPARPSGQVIEEGFRPRVSEKGQRHPVTANLPGANGRETGDDPDWGRWFRLIGVDQLSGQEVMEGPDGRPVLILDHYGEGRVAQMMSDHAWLWTRGFEGGGPQAELLRRLAHWLMKEPELEEEVLHGSIKGGELSISRRTMASAVPLITVTTPSGKENLLSLDQQEPGFWTGTLPVDELGLYHITDGAKTALAVSGPVNPREYADVLATEEILSPLMEDTGGTALWATDTPDPEIRRISGNRRAFGKDWLGVKRNNAYVVTDTRIRPLLPPLVALVIGLGLLILTWRREAA